LLIKVNDVNRAEFDQTIQVELFTEGGRVVHSHIVHPGAVPAIISLDPQQGAVYLKITLPAGEAMPDIWLVPAEEQTH
jgi:hypothetical protein